MTTVNNQLHDYISSIGGEGVGFTHGFTVYVNQQTTLTRENIIKIQDIIPVDTRVFNVDNNDTIIYEYIENREI